jgi:MoxR-like ATPase
MRKMAPPSLPRSDRDRLTIRESSPPITPSGPIFRFPRCDEAATFAAIPMIDPASSASTAVTPEMEEEMVGKLGAARSLIGRELRKVIIGQDAVVEQMLIALLSGGHCLITGAPGLAKTLLVSTLAQVFDLSFRRIQFTPDLMPSDITGTEILEDTPEGRRELVFSKGPIFANIILADEINRTPPKTQAALLEAMQEKQVTVAGNTLALEKPFFVLATQNPIEMEGTYPLPEAQLDRFMFNVVINYLKEDEEVAVVTQTTGAGPEKVSSVFSGEDLLKCHSVVRRVPIASEVVRYAVRLAAASRPGQPGTSAYINDWVNWGAGTRAGQSLVLGAKTRALLDGRTHVTYEDIRELAAPVLRHRILTNYRAEAEGITVESVITKLLSLTSEK